MVFSYEAYVMIALIAFLIAIVKIQQQQYEDKLKNQHIASETNISNITVELERVKSDLVRSQWLYTYLGN